MSRIVLPFDRVTIGTPGAQYGDRVYWSGTGSKRRQIKHFHPGVDLQVRAGLAVRAAADGVIAERTDSGVRGHMIAIDHGDRTGHRYHMLASRGRPAVGTRVRRGDIVGYVADEDEWGSSSNGDHIHMEYRTDGRIRGETAPRANTPNPLNYLTTPAGEIGEAILMATPTEIWDHNIGENGEARKNDMPAWRRLGMIFVETVLPIAKRDGKINPVTKKPYEDTPRGLIASAHAEATWGKEAAERAERIGKDVLAEVKKVSAPDVTVDAATVKRALLDPEVQAAIGKSVVDEFAARLKS